MRSAARPSLALALALTVAACGGGAGDDDGPSFPSATCGDGVVAPDAGEACDDQGTAAGDGCSAACSVEAGFSCTGSPSVCSATCGDGVVASGGGEACDDQNTASGDGCSDACQLESGYTCTGSPTACTTVCGDGIPAGMEACDDGNLAGGDGCEADCTLTPAGNPSLVSLSPSSASVLAGGTVFFTVTLSSPAAADTFVGVSVDPVGAGLVPGGGVTVLAGQTAATFTYTDLGTASTAQVSAALGAVVLTAAVRW